MSTTETQTVVTSLGKPEEIPSYPKPLELTGVLEEFKQFDVTPSIGREYIDVNLKEWLEVSLNFNLSSIMSADLIQGTQL